MMFNSIRRLSPSLILEFKTRKSTLRMDLKLFLAQWFHQPFNITCIFTFLLIPNLSFSYPSKLSHTLLVTASFLFHVLTTWKKPVFSLVYLSNICQRFIIKDSSRSSSSSKSSIGIPKGSMMLQHLNPSSLGSKGPRWWAPFTLSRSDRMGSPGRLTPEQTQKLYWLVSVQK